MLTKEQREEIVENVKRSYPHIVGGIQETSWLKGKEIDDAINSAITKTEEICFEERLDLANKMIKKAKQQERARILKEIELLKKKWKERFETRGPHQPGGGIDDKKERNSFRRGYEVGYERAFDESKKAVEAEG